MYCHISWVGPRPWWEHNNQPLRQKRQRADQIPFLSGEGNSAHFSSLVQSLFPKKQWCRLIVSVELALLDAQYVIWTCWTIEVLDRSGDLWFCIGFPLQNHEPRMLASAICVSLWPWYLQKTVLFCLVGLLRYHICCMHHHVSRGQTGSRGQEILHQLFRYELSFYCCMI